MLFFSGWMGIVGSKAECIHDGCMNALHDNVAKMFRYLWSPLSSEILYAAITRVRSDLGDSEGREGSITTLVKLWI